MSVSSRLKKKIESTLPISHFHKNSSTLKEGQRNLNGHLYGEV